VSAGSRGWDEYAPFYDWENARTFGRRDVAFWRRIVRREAGPALELGCGTGRLLMPLARTGSALVGLDRSAPMLAQARARAVRITSARRPAIVQGDAQALPFRAAAFDLVIAPYGLLQSLTSDRALNRALGESARVLRRGGLLGIDLVPELAEWPSYRKRVTLRGRRDRRTTLTLVESVRRDERRGLTIFDEEFVERRGQAVRRRRFSLTFRTLPMKATFSRIERAGFEIEAVLGDYGGGAWHTHATSWIVLARKAS
jgi:ubiquinone/menaquinone biosynthesis C-methylase UbiE